MISTHKIHIHRHRASRILRVWHSCSSQSKSVTHLSHPLLSRPVQPNKLAQTLAIQLPYNHHSRSQLAHSTMVSNDDHKQASDQGHDNEEISGEKNEWKFREPYKIHKEDGGDKFDAVLEGHCHCEKVRSHCFWKSRHGAGTLHSSVFQVHFQLSRDAPLSAKYCHCTTCQVIHGS